jgi:triacylglycerol lipase
MSMTEEIVVARVVHYLPLGPFSSCGQSLNSYYAPSLALSFSGLLRWLILAGFLICHLSMEQYLEVVQKLYPSESLFLCGHSAGGVLGRLYMVEHPDIPIGALITFASPHLGTDSAEIGAKAGNSPLGWFAPLIGGAVLSRSQGLYNDLIREQPGSLLFWLNRQEHPSSRYISVVREGDGLLDFGDLVVPAWSQDMNHVVALRGRSRKIVTRGGHGLSIQDGELLLKILGSIVQT